MSEENTDPFQEGDPPPVNPPSSSNNSNTRQFYASDTGKYNFGDHPNPTVYLQGMGTCPGICVSASFVMGNNYVNFGVSPGFDGHGLGVNPGGSIIVRNLGDPGWTVITDIGGSGGGGGGGTTPNGPENSVQFNSGSTFTGTSSLQFFEANPTTGGVCTLTVDGNIFSSMGVSDVTSQEPKNIYQLTTSEYVNGVVFLPYQVTGEEQFYQVRVPSATSVSTDFRDVLKPGQFFDTILYGTSLGVSQTVLSIGDTDNPTTTYYPVDITVLCSFDNTTIFDTRLIRDRSGFTGQGLSFHFSELGLEYYQSVVIRSRYNSSTGISMYPISNSFYTF